MFIPAIGWEGCPLISQLSNRLASGIFFKACDNGLCRSKANHSGAIFMDIVRTDIL